MLAGTAIVSLAAILGAAHAQAGDNFNIPAQPLPRALAQFGAQSGFEIIADSTLTASKNSPGITGTVDPDAALSHMLRGTGLTYRRDDGSYVILAAPPRQVAEAAPAHAAAAVETVVVTSSKIKGDIQTVPIAITALSQEQLTSRQIAGGPDLVKEVPNLTFSKTNFTGYNIQIRGIGTQAISVTTDPAVAVALNDIPFIRNHFFEQEFYDVGQVEVLRGPQGTLYGRNATAGVVNVITAKPTDQFEAMLSADWGNYTNRRYEGMVNIPIVDDRLDLRVAGEWTKRDGYSFNQLTGQPIDGRDLWSSRVSLNVRPVESVQATLIWEHFSESDDRLRTAKQLCKTAPLPDSVDGISVPTGAEGGAGKYNAGSDYLSQGCLPTSLYSPNAFEVPNGYSLPYFGGLEDLAAIHSFFDPYASTTQSRNLRVIESTINPHYRAKNDTLELNADYQVAPSLTFTSQTGYNNDFLYSTEDYDRFNSAPGAFAYNYQAADQAVTRDPSGLGHCEGQDGACANIPRGAVCTPSSVSDSSCIPDGVFCDPQLGCSDRLVAEDVSDEHAWQLSQEFRLSSNFSGPLNFSVGGNYLHYETEENYYVFINTLSLFAIGWTEGVTPQPYVQGVSDNSYCLYGGFKSIDPANPQPLPYSAFGGAPRCIYVDPNPLSSVNNQGHNYFLSQNPYVLNSYAGFGEVYYQVASTLKLTGGLRWTDDQKHFTDIPSLAVVPGYGYASTGTVNQQWDQWTGRAAVNWTPKLDFTDQTLVYGSYAHGYKAGGANPPGAIFPLVTASVSGPRAPNPIHPLTFKPEFIDAFELGSKNTLLDGGLTLNGDVFYYNYKGYQISRIVDRTAINDNFDAHIKGAELETTWEAAPGLKFSFAGGYEDARAAKGSHSVDLMDRTAGHPGWMVVKPFISDASNCVLPDYVVAALVSNGAGLPSACGTAYIAHEDPVGPASAPAGYSGFDPVDQNATNYDPYLGIDVGPAPNNGQGFDKNLSGNQLPNAPHFTTSFTAEYTIPVSENWAATLHSDFYWQSQSWARIFNDNPYDKIRGYSNVNLALILTSADGWQVLGYLKNVFNTTAITGDFLNSDDTGLTTNVFLTDPRLFGVRVTKNW